MKKNKLLIALAIAACTSVVMADDNKIDYSVGLKIWNNKLGSYTNAANSPLVSLTARKGDYFLVGSFMLPATYTWNDSSGEYMTRRDADLAVGWRMNSNISLLAGQKKLAVDNYYSSTNHYETLNITYLGANASNMIDENKFVFGQIVSSIKGKASGSNSNSKMNIYEVGLGFVVSPKTQMTGGYRFQKFTIDSTTNIRGPIFGLNHNF